MNDAFDISISLDALNGFTPTIRPLADGLRASTAAECASCAIIQYLNPNDERVAQDVVNEGVATLGHLLHQAWAFQAFDGYARYEVEAAIPWAHGVSHDDVVVYESTDPRHVGIYECKTHSDTKPKAPSAAHRRQSEFRLRLRERAGLPVPGPMRIIMIGKAGREGGWVRGPWEVPLTNDRRAEIDATLDAIDAFLAAPPFDLHSGTLKTLGDGCTRCFPKPQVPAANGADGWIARYLNLRDEHAQVDEKRKQFAAEAKELKRLMDDARSELDKLVPDGVVVEGMRGTATRTRSGSLTIRSAA